MADRVEPTKEQIQWLLEQCGLTHKEDFNREPYWELPDGSFIRALPDIDSLEFLGFLFKYAVPKAVKALQERSKAITPPLQISEVTAFRELMELWLAENPIQFGFEVTLFWTIYKALGGE